VKVFMTRSVVGAGDADELVELDDDHARKLIELGFADEAVEAAVPDEPEDGDATAADDEQQGAVAGLPGESDSKATWEQYAEDHGLDVDSSLKAADYKQAVRKAVNSR
jgi:hypothetical protein